MRCQYLISAAMFHTGDGKLHTSVHTFSFEGTSIEQFESVLAWCCENFGEDPTNDSWWRFGLAIAIVGNDDAFTFRMRWGGLIDD
jgi:hypothetical protein